MTVRTRLNSIDFGEAVLDLVERIPPGRVMTYKAIALHLGQGGPRGVGGVLLRDGLFVPWWRVVRVDGAIAPHLMIDAQQHWIIENTPVRRGRVHLELAHWWPDEPDAVRGMCR